MPTPTTFQDLIGKAKVNFEEAKRLLNTGNAEEMAQAQKLLDEAKSLSAQAQQAKGLEDAMADLESKFAAPEQPAESKGAAPAEKFGDMGEYLYKCWQWASTGKPDRRLKFFRDPDEPTEKKDMSEGVGAAGGFLVPPEFSTSMMSVAGEMSIIRNRATKIRMARRQINIPVLDQTGTTAGRPHWFGGLRVYWQAEASQKTSSDAAFRSITLTAHKMIMYTRASDELVDDSAISLNDFLNGPLGFPGAIAWEEDWAFLNGNGAGQPLGVINAPATITVNRVDQNNVTYDDLVNMLASMYSGSSPVWLAHQTLLPKLLLMNGPTGNPVYLWGSARDGVPNTLLGYPIYFSEKPPAISNTSAGDIGLYDFKYYLIGDRQATTVESTKFDRWEYDQTSWRAVHRVDGQPWLSAPLTYWDGSTTVSPFVILGAKST